MSMSRCVIAEPGSRGGPKRSAQRSVNILPTEGLPSFHDISTASLACRNHFGSILKRPSFVEWMTSSISFRYLGSP